MKDKSIRVIFWITAVVFLGVMFMLTGLVRFPGYGYTAVFSSWVLLTGLGIALMVLVLKKKTVGKQKAFLLLTGAAAAGFLVFVALHNVVSAVFQFEEAVFFIMAIMLCPAGLLVGVTGTIIVSAKDRPSANPAKYVSGGEGD